MPLYHMYIYTYTCSVNISVNVSLNSNVVLLSVGDFWQISVLLCGDDGDSKVDGSVLTGSDCNAEEWAAFI